MRFLGLLIMLTGMFMFASGWLFLDLASMPLKDDLYSIDVLGFLNTFFSTDEKTATVQTVLSAFFIIIGYVSCVAGALMLIEKEL